MVDYNPDDTTLLAKAVRVGIHEITHALGFTSSNYAYYAVPNPVKMYTKTDSTTFHRMETPTVAQYAQAHYGCPSLTGVDLENNDPDGVGSHWEKRIIGAEFMSPTIDEQVFLSAITLGLYKDMGWYDPNFNFAETFSWGYGEGCGFALGSCGTWSSQFFCKVDQQKGCTGDLTARGQCVLYRYPSLPPSEQYLSDPKLGGLVWSDYCPTFITYTTGLCTDALNLAPRLATNPKYNEYYGTSSRCFNIYESSFPTTTTNGACYETKCILRNSQVVLQFSVRGTWYSCPSDGGTVSLKVSDGTSIVVTCPRAGAICSPAVVSIKNARTLLVVLLLLLLLILLLVTLPRLLLMLLPVLLVVGCPS
eukprot:TRINITY_DN343_c0_g2_i4.p1 TRINITY_DN343_c0_g2~~TRINITY_DN343_c0_g2_i4.p1  ORF type:complete len:363 (-),score=47.63 TRINITY_DN343_c0_g2_i4:54-1142(-)